MRSTRASKILVAALLQSQSRRRQNLKILLEHSEESIASGEMINQRSSSIGFDIRARLGDFGKLVGCITSSVCKSVWFYCNSEPFIQIRSCLRVSDTLTPEAPEYPIHKVRVLCRSTILPLYDASEILHDHMMGAWNKQSVNRVCQLR